MGSKSLTGGLEMARLASKVIVVLGASQGLGAATSRRLAAEGAKLVLAGIGMERGEQLAASIVESGGCAHYCRADLRDADSLSRLMDDVVTKYGHLDGLFNNAADMSLIGVDGDAVEIGIDTFDATIAADLRGLFLACRFAIPKMLASGGGSIVQSSSAASLAAEPTRVAYACAKAGLDALTRHVAVRWGKSKIRCNSIAPGMIMTETALLYADMLPLADLLRRTASPRLGQPDDIANVVTFLLSDESAFINGQVISVDGGLTMCLGDPRPPD
jgi:NAD(P)-dependent dehydrogenase (short-subunit alcohol dehydrogenase family)